MLCGTAMNAPGRPNAIAKPAPGAGGLVTGSGNDANPWARMHRDMSSNLSLSASDAWPPSEPGPGSKLLHALWADWNAGDSGLIPEPTGILTPPPPPGSGKFGTPCERMQSANLIPVEAPPAPVDELDEEPHAATASTQPARASERTGRMRACFTHGGITGA